MISSNERPNASSAPASRAVRIAGNVPHRKVVTPSAPRSIDASTIEPDERRKRATTLLNTTTTQKVACPTMIAGMPKFSPGIASTIDDNASAVTIPGKAIGRTSANEIVSRPKNLARAIANDASVPSTRAINVAQIATRKELVTGCRRSVLCHAVVNHDVVTNDGGHETT